jgi:hypothetical protein
MSVGGGVTRTDLEPIIDAVAAAIRNLPVDETGDPVTDSTANAIKVLQQDPTGSNTVINTVPIQTDYGQVVRPVPGEFMLEVARGNVAGTTGVNKFGRNPIVAADSTEDIWDGSAVYVWPTTAVITHVSQTTDQAAMRGQTIEVMGLDANWDVVTQNAVLDATDTTTIIALTTPLIRVFRKKVQANVVADSDIRAHDAGETQDYSIITAGNNQTLMAIYTVPNGKTAYMEGYYANLNQTANVGPTACNVRLFARDNDAGYERQVKHFLGLDPDATSHFNHQFRPYTKFTQKTDIFIDATSEGKASDVSAGFDLILVDN